MGYCPEVILRKRVSCARQIEVRMEPRETHESNGYSDILARSISLTSHADKSPLRCLKLHCSRNPQRLRTLISSCRSCPNFLSNPGYSERAPPRKFRPAILGVRLVLLKACQRCQVPRQSGARKCRAWSKKSLETAQTGMRSGISIASAYKVLILRADWLLR